MGDDSSSSSDCQHFSSDIDVIIDINDGVTMMKRLVVNFVVFVWNQTN